MFFCNYSRDEVWVERAREASGKAVGPALGHARGAGQSVVGALRRRTA
jgi:hypothetical protein